MICFSNKKIICHQSNSNEGEFRNVLLQYFENVEQEAIIALYNETGNLIGWSSYEDLLEKEEYINFEYFTANAFFWDSAREHFTNSCNKKGLLIDQQGNPLAFYYEAEILTSFESRYFDCVERMRKQYPGNFSRAYPEIRQVCLMGLNEYTWRVFHLLREEGISVTIFGDEWEWFGVKNAENNICFSEKCAFIFADRKYADNGELIGYRYLLHWAWEIAKQVHNEELEKLRRKGTNICKVKFPSRHESIKIENWPKSDLLNSIIPLDIMGSISSDILTKKREIDFYGEETYNKLVNKEDLNIGGWEPVLFRKVKVERIKGIHKKNRIYLVGPCIMENLFALAKYSVVGELQKLVAQYDYEVVRVVIPRERMDFFKAELENLPLHKKDILISLNYDNYFYEGDNSLLDMTDLYSCPRMETWIGDGALLHLNAAGNKAVAQEVFNKYLKNKCEELSYISTENNEWIQEGTLIDEDTKECINQYVTSVRAIEPNSITKIGGIVMNCNPFTRGHQYLIETALKSVDFLYVFVVEEDRSIFPFEMRMQMVKKGIEHLSNVAIVPSGNYVLSYDTLPVYFEKAEKQEVRIDASNDLEVFARYIAPMLGISYRFVGEEPTDLVTRQYNEQMKEILPPYGIEVVEIRRKLVREELVISASRVRKLLSKKDWLGIKEFVPDTTYYYLQKLLSIKIAVYGAGKWGGHVHAWLKNLNCCIIGWYDKNYLNFAEEMQVKAPLELKNTEYDCVLIAVESRELFQEIKEFLCEELNVEDEKIIGPVSMLFQAMFRFF